MLRLAVPLVASVGLWLAVGAGLWADPAFSRPADPDGKPESDLVYCYDSRLGIVQRKLSGNCDGEAVTRDQAEKIKAEALERRRKMLSSPPKAVISGHKLRGIGTGFFVTRDGKLVTNNHVVDGCGRISAELPDGRNAEAHVIDTLPSDDLALLEAPLTAAETATFGTAVQHLPGAPIMVIGYPDQGLAPIKPLLTPGTLGGASIVAGGNPRFAINADIRHGNSGGPVVDERALVIGVVYAKVNSVAVFEATGKLVRYVGAVIDNKAVLPFLERNAVAYRKADGGPDVSAVLRDQHLRRIVARIGCWK